MLAVALLNEPTLTALDEHKNIHAMNFFIINDKRF